MCAACREDHEEEKMLVKDVMESPVITIHPEATLRQAAERMLEHGINGLPVVDDEECVVGIIGLKDILRAPMPSLARARVSRLTPIGDIARHLEARRVNQVMATRVWSVKEDDPVMAAVAIMVNQGLHPVPVLRDEQLVGVISRADAVRALLDYQLEPVGPSLVRRNEPKEQ
jgi:CBS domain-containing protein